MTPESFEKIAELLTEHSSIIPTTLKILWISFPLSEREDGEL